MAGLRTISSCHNLTFWTLAIALLTFSLHVCASDETQWVRYVTDEETIFLDNNRRPSLYTGDFGDCLGNSPIHVSRFDASLYKDNMTVMIHIEGTTNISDDRPLMSISVHAYGETRLNMLINPCTIDTPTLCHIRPDIPIEANGMLPIGASDLAGVPDIAYSIPDFEGQAVLRIYSPTLQTQIACYAAVMTNGNSFSHPAAVGSIIGIFVFVAVVSSAALAASGQVIPEMRTHYAHSVSIFVVFSVLQHIFFTGMLSVDWPSALVAFWSNYAWAAGLIYTEGMQKSIDKFTGSKFDNIGKIGAAPSNRNYTQLGGAWGSATTTTTKRSILSSLDFISDLQTRSAPEHQLQRRNMDSKQDGFLWYGNPVAPGLPLPGNYSGFAGTLAQLQIPASNAFLTALIWLLVMVLFVLTATTILKCIIELRSGKGRKRNERWNFFRSRWLTFMKATLLRLLYIAFFMMIVLALFQFALGGAAGPLAITAIVFIAFLVGVPGLAAYALWYRLRNEKFTKDPDRVQIVFKKHGLGLTRESTSRRNESEDRIIRSFSWTNFHFVDLEDRPHVHEDADYIMKFGWLVSRFRKSKWWFFSVWLFYEFIRACFYGGAVRQPLVQILGLLIWEIIAFVTIVIIKPFESNRLNLVMVYLLSFSKISTVGLSLAFVSRFALGRILATVIGVVIIVIQGLLTVALLVTIALGAASSWMSMERDKDHEEFKPRRWVDYRIRYFDHIEQKATDEPKKTITVSTPALSQESEKPKEAYFAVSTVRRQPKIEDEDEAVVELNTMTNRQSLDQVSIISPSRSRPLSMHSNASNVPFGAKLHRASWSTRSLSKFGDVNVARRDTDAFTLHSTMSSDSLPEVTPRHRPNSIVESRPRPTSLSSAEFQGRTKRRSTTFSGPLRTGPLKSPLIEKTEDDIENEFRFKENRLPPGTAT